MSVFQNFFGGGALRPEDLQNVPPLSAYAPQRAPAPAVPVEKMETIESEIMAWRGWNLSWDDPYDPILQSASQNTLWRGPTVVADKAPELGGKTGIYALSEREVKPKHDFYGDSMRGWSRQYLSMPVSGTVALSGVVVEGEYGYRAERATIRSLRLNLSGPIYSERLLAPIEIAAALEHRYEVEVEFVKVFYSNIWHQPGRDAAYHWKELGKILGGK